MSAHSKAAPTAGSKVALWAVERAEWRAGWKAARLAVRWD